MVKPRVLSVPPAVGSRWREAVEACAAAALILDAHQIFVLKHALGFRADGRWAAFEVAVNEARQNGKGGILEGRELPALFAFGERLIIHSAHEFATASEAFRRMLELIETAPEFDQQVKRVSRAHGEEGIELKSGQRIRYRTRTKGGGRGFTGDLVVLDEAMDLPAAVIAALMPTMSARSMVGNPQLWYAGSAVDQVVHEHGVTFAKLRSRAIAGGDPSLAYLEWSANVGGPADDDPERLDAAVLANVRRWRQANPALGLRISEEHVENELRSMQARTFAVERLGIGDWPAVDGTDAAVIAIEDWLELVDSRSSALDPVCFAFDVTPDRSFASIGAAGAREDGLAHLEVVEHRRGTGWVVPRLVELQAHRPVGFVCDASGPAASLLVDLEKAGIEVLPLTGREHANACGLFFDLVEQKTGRHLGTPELEEAVRGAVKRPLGDAWAWSRARSGPVISPLVAVTLALYGFTSLKKPRRAPMVAFA